MQWIGGFINITMSNFFLVALEMVFLVGFCGGLGVAHGRWLGGLSWSLLPLVMLVPFFMWWYDTLEGLCHPYGWACHLSLNMCFVLACCLFSKINK